MSVNQQVLSMALLQLEGLSSARSLSAAIQLRYSAWDDIASARIDPSAYNDPEVFARDYQAVELLRKFADLPNASAKDRAAAARESFYDCERSCFATNRRLAPLLLDPFHYGERVAEFIDRARKMLKWLLGPCPANPSGRFGPGATYGDRGRLTTIPDKMSSNPTLTSGAFAYLVPWTGTLWARACASAPARRDPTFVRGNRFTTVPKDSLKDRGICIEPSVNLFYQLGFGRAMKDALARRGINLRDGQTTHRRVACSASADGLMATLDLSNASDTVSHLLVELLLPRDWFTNLNELRSPSTFIDDRWVRLEKFSSMGNGFTFELETAIFTSLMLALDPALTPGVDLFVYGDDIIVPVGLGADAVSALKFFGFEVNERKSFVNGPFRESCGGDYFYGVDVRPFLLKETPCEPQHFITWANGIRRFSASTPSRFRDLRRAWFHILDGLPSAVRRCRGPAQLGDLVIHDDESRWETRTRNCIRYVRVYRPARFKRIGLSHFRSDVQLASAIYGAVDCDSRGAPLGVAFRDNVLGYKVGWVPFS